MKTKERYLAWLNDKGIDEDTKALMKVMTEDDIADSFYKELEFGTGGIRGILGIGTNRMNRYVISKVTKALGMLICEEGGQAKEQGVVISFDVRHGSREFASVSARVLCALGIKVYLFDDIRATPQLSFSVRELGAKAGIMVTASHNPKEYNGYKAYWDDGAQILPSFAEKIEKTAKKIKTFDSIAIMDEALAREKGLLITPPASVDEKYIKNVLSLALNDDIDKSIPIIYTPLHGTGAKPVIEVLERRGFENIYTVSEQMTPDPEFTYAPFPNPEDERAFELSIKLGKEKKASLLIANDPDGDRTAIMVSDGHEYIFMNGNQIGAVLIKYMMDALTTKQNMPDKAMIVKTIVTGDLGKVIAADYNVETFETLTGFKNISSVAMQKEEEGYKFLFGYEESIGYNAGTFVRDKDGVTAAMLICEAAAFYLKQKKTLYDVLIELFEKYGYYLENNVSVTLTGRQGTKKIAKIMAALRENRIKAVAGRKIEAVTDYSTQIRTVLKTNKTHTVDIPQSDVLKFEAQGNLWFAVRPSGTEPKLKIYVYGTAMDKASSKALVEKAANELKAFAEGI